MSDETEEQKKLMRQIDISCVQAFHTMDEIDAMVELAKKYRLAAVFTLPAFSAHVAERLQDTREIHAGGVVSFPGGGDTTGQKKRQAKELWEAGCREIRSLETIQEMQKAGCRRFGMGMRSVQNLIKSIYK